MKKAMFLLIFMTSCSSLNNNSCTCPQIRKYSTEEQLNQAKEENLLIKNGYVAQELIELYSLRSQLKACNGD